MMNKNNFYTVLRSALLTGLLLAAACQFVAAKSYFSFVERPLPEVLNEFGEKYQVFFSYDSESLRKVNVDFEFKTDESLESAITRLLAPTNFKYESFGDKYYVVYEKSREGNRTSRKLRKYIKKIQQLENRGKISLQRRDGNPTQQLEQVAGATLEMSRQAAVRAKENRRTSAEIRGRIMDGATDKPLISATVFIKGTSLGDVTNEDGEYRLTDIPAGEYLLMASYIGYETDSVLINLADGQALEQNFTLNPVAYQGEIVVVTGMREGQSAAINKQVKSNTIVNVVSSERIRELPDENAAESVGRLPGISVRRSGGEGQRINVRGLSPKFSTVAVDGVNIPPTGQGRQVFNLYLGAGQRSVPNVDDRSVDLSMISSEALAGIEVYKSLTPDQDGDAIGGRVNFVSRKAPRGARYRVNVLGGYNHYHDSFNNFKANGSYSNRFFDNKLGMFLNGGYSIVDRSSDNDQVTYLWRGEVVLRGLALTDQIVERERYNANIALDYDLGNTDLTLTGMYTGTGVDSRSRTLDINSLTNGGNWGAGHNRSNIALFNASLGATHQFTPLEVDWKVNFIQTTDENPYSYGYGFSEPNPLSNQDIPRIDPYRTAEFTNFDPNTASGGQPGGGDVNRRVDGNWVAQLNLKRNFRLGTGTSGFLKAGGKLISRKRFRERTGQTHMQNAVFVDAYFEDNPEARMIRGQPALINFWDEGYSPGNFFDGVYPFPIQLSTDAPKQLFDQYFHLRRAQLVSGENDYDVHENTYAGYIMTDMKIGSRISLVGGVRYEHSDNHYTANQLNNYDESLVGESIIVAGSIEEASSSQNYGEWLPMVNVRFNIFQNQENNNGLDLRLAATRSLTRPDFYNLTPFINIRTNGGSINRSEPDLLPTTAWNYDAFLTLFNNRFGLFTVGAFYKELDNIDFIYGREVEKDIIIERFGEEYGLSDGYNVIEPINATQTTFVRGLELELQANFSFLPSPFDGIILYGNYSRINSQAYYPQRVAVFDLETFTTTLFDSTRVAGMPGQSQDIANVALGYEKGIFSGRLSYSYQGPALDFIGANELLDGYIDGFTRLDLSVNVNVSDNWVLMANVNNILNQYDRTFTGVDRLPGGSSIFGTVSWLGLRYVFSGR